MDDNEFKTIFEIDQIRQLATFNFSIPENKFIACFPKIAILCYKVKII